MGNYFAHTSGNFATEIKTYTYIIYKNMATISPSDTLSISAIRNGMLCLSFTLDGCSSMTDVMRELRHAAGNLTGLITLKLRNITQGWSDRRSLMLRPLPGSATGYPSLFEAV